MKNALINLGLFFIFPVSSPDVFSTEEASSPEGRLLCLSFDSTGFQRISREETPGKGLPFYDCRTEISEKLHSKEIVSAVKEGFVLKNKFIQLL